MNFQERLLKSIPGGAHTYSRGFDQFPSNAPQILVSGKGVETLDTKGNKFIDYGMALRAVNIGYAEEEINNAAIREILAGNNLTRPSMIELEAAELLIELIDSIEMVKFAKNGSSAVSAAVKLARAYTGKDVVLRCAEQPFFSYDDWFIGSTVMDRGVPNAVKKLTQKFKFNDIESLDQAISQSNGQVACVILEPATTSCPSNCRKMQMCKFREDCIFKNEKREKNFLQKVQELCNKNGIVFILDEMITGFRWDLLGAQHFYNVQPDLTTFGKAMANGFSLSCVGGKREIMELGSIERSGEERVFLLSSTHGAEMSSLGAFVATIDFMRSHKVVEHNWDYGSLLINGINERSVGIGIFDHFQAAGFPCSPIYVAKNLEAQESLEYRTLFLQEMIKNGILMPWISIAYRHNEDTLEKTLEAVEKSLLVYRNALKYGVEKYLEGPVIKPVFRKYN